MNSCILDFDRVRANTRLALHEKMGLALFAGKSKPRCLVGSTAFHPLEMNHIEESVQVTIEKRYLWLVNLQNKDLFDIIIPIR